MLVLEFANREMVDRDMLPALVERVLAFLPRDRFWVTVDYGFSALSRWMAREKLCAMVAGT